VDVNHHGKTTSGAIDSETGMEAHCTFGDARSRVKTRTVLDGAIQPDRLNAAAIELIAD
jgi:hypothetical protein